MNLIQNALKVTFPIMLLSLVGCSNNSTPTQQTSASAANNGTTETKKEEFVSKLPADAPVLKVSTNSKMPPFSYQDDLGKLQGIDVDSIRAIGEEAGYRVELFDDAWQELFSNVEEGKRDLAISGISYKPDRAAKYALSKSYFFNPSGVMYINPNLTVNKLSDLRGLKIGAMDGSKQVDQVRSVGGIIETRATMHLAFEGLAQSKLDGIVSDVPLLQHIALNYPDIKTKIVPYEGENDPSAQQVIVMKKGNDELVNKINTAIDKLKADGTFAKIEQKWLGTPAQSAEQPASTAK